MTTPEQFDFDVFLAHNSADKTQVEEIRAKLMRKGISPWLDKYDLRPLYSNQEQLQEVISKISSAAIFIGSSGLGHFEDIEMKTLISQSTKRKVNIGLVILPDCSNEVIKNACESLFIAEKHWVDFRQSSPDPMEQLVWAITGYKYGYHLKELIQIIEPIDFNTTVVKAYRYSLPELSTPKIPNSLEALVLFIAGIPGEKDESKPLWRFVNFLINDRSVDSECQQALKAWAEVQKIPLESTSVTIQDESEVEETYLMIKVMSLPLGGYTVSAAIATDSEPLNPDVKIIPTSIDIPISPDPKYLPGYSQEQLPLILEELIAICGDQFSIPLTDLVVQWFLPLELMGVPVEYWQLPIGRQKLCNGGRCKVVIVRSSNRHFSSDYRSVSGEWKKYWKRLVNNLNCPSSQALYPLDPIAGQGKIDWNQTNVVGCKFIEHGHSTHQEDFWEDFWDDLLGQGLPIALWSRQPVINKQRAREAMEYVANCSLAKLPQVLTEYRGKTSSTSDTAIQPEIQLSLLWDNPFRPFPTIPYKSQ
jgi:hypothetical protein